MELVGKLHAPAGHDHETFKRLVEQIAEVSLQNVTLVAIGKGVDAPAGTEAKLMINSVQLPNHVTTALENALKEFYGFSFQVSSSGDEVAQTQGDDTERRMLAVVSIHRGMQQAAIESAERRAQDARLRSEYGNTYVDEDPFVIRDSAGIAYDRYPVE